MGPHWDASGIEGDWVALLVCGHFITVVICGSETDKIFGLEIFYVLFVGIGLCSVFSRHVLVEGDQDSYIHGFVVSIE